MEENFNAFDPCWDNLIPSFPSDMDYYSGYIPLPKLMSHKDPKRLSKKGLFIILILFIAVILLFSGQLKKSFKK